MSKLLQRLSDPVKSGIYKSSRSDEILEAARGSTLKVTRIGLAGAVDKDSVLASFAQALAFPKWYGSNWDALEDCLGDLAWLDAGGHILLIEGAQHLASVERGVLVDILASSAASWAERKRPFFAVFLDGEPGLPDLYNDRR
jgi:hypothetical protein